MNRPNFINGKAATVRLSAVAATALGLPANGQEVELAGFVVLDGGWLQADYATPDGYVDRYLLPPGSVLYVKQRQTSQETGTDAPEPGRVPNRVPAPTRQDGLEKQLR